MFGSKNLFSVERMVPANMRLGEIPSTKTAYRDVIKIALPSVMEMVLISLVSSVDIVMIGSLGPAAIAAVGLTGQPRMLMLSVFFALNIGVTAVVARRKGEGRQDKANEAVRNALMVITVLSVIIMAAVLPFTRDLMRFFGAEADTLDMASSYFSIVFYVFPINAMLICINAAQRGVGNTRIALYSNIFSNIVNIILNYLLIGGRLGFPALGVKGAAIGTALGFVAAFSLSLYSITSKKSLGSFLHLSPRDDWRLRKESLKAIGKIGGNAMVEQIALRVGFILYALFVAKLGTLAFAAHQICMQFLNISFSFGDGIGVAGTSLVGQMLGKKRHDLAMMYGKVSQRMALVVALVLATMIIIFRYPLVAVFASSDVSDPKDLALVRDMAVQVMYLVAAFQPLQTSSVVISGALRGAGDNLFVAGIMLVCVTLIRPILSYVGINFLGLGLLGAWGASLVDMTVRLTFVYHRFNSGKWFHIKV